MNKVLVKKTFFGSPDGVTVIEYKAGSKVEMPDVLYEQLKDENYFESTDVSSTKKTLSPTYEKKVIDHKDKVKKSKKDKTK